jgi:PAS domain S-box-containing protein
VTDDRATLLLVDDQPQNLLALQAVLEPLGHELVTAQSGEQALRELLHRDVAVILLDVQMPGLDGFETAELIKQRERTHHIPIIFLTAISKDSEHVFRGYSTGAVDYMFKPFEPAILLSKVSVFVELWQKTRELRRQAELLAEREVAEARRESEERYRSLAESIPQQVWIAAPDGTLEWWNARLTEYFGTESAAGLQNGSVVHPEEVEESLRAWEHALSSGEPFEREYRLRRADGAYRWHLSRAVPMRDGTGRVVRWFATNTDIHDRKRAEQAQRLLVDAGELLSSSLDYRATLSAMARAVVPRIADWCAIAIREADGSVRELAVAHADADKARLAEEMVQRYPPKEQTGAAHVIATGEPLLVPRLSDNLLRAIAVDELHLELLRELGLESYIGIPLVLRGETIGAISLVQAGSGRRYDEDDLAFAQELARRASTAIEQAELYREVEERARAARVLAAVGDGVTLIDRDGVIRLWNPAAETIVGLTETEVLGRRASDVVPGWEGLAERVPVASERAAGEARAETLPLELGGRELWLSISGVGSEEGTVYAFRDLTDERALEEMKSDFVATVSHELRTPLAAIHGAALTILRPDLKLDGELRERLLRVISEESERLAQIVNDLLVASHLDSGQVRSRIESCDPRALAEAVLDAARTHLPEHVTLELSAPGDLPQVAADAEQLRQVLGNLVENAVKYSPDGGAVRVRLEASDGTVRFAVSDDGLGIPASEHRRVFEKFYRLDPNMTRGIGGTGLGLYISRELVRTMNGRIWVDSTVGSGSTFHVEIPQPAPERRPPTSRERERAASQR